MENKKVKQLKIPIDANLYFELIRLGIIDNTQTRNTNVGTSDYSKHLIQPWTIWNAYPELTSWDHDIIKRVLRKKSDNPREMDYKKIIHDCQERLRQIEVEKEINKLKING